MERGIVRGRVASLLRSSEIKPYVLLICTFFCLPQKHPGSLESNDWTYSRGKEVESCIASPTLKITSPKETECGSSSTLSNS